MTSLIFWGPYLAHKHVVDRRREKQRVKNYERWEGLRDDYDDQRKISRESKSLDIQRTSSWETNPYDQPGILSLRDQQEANDARTSWRPQESWDGSRQKGQMTGQYQQSQSTGYQQSQLTGQQQQFQQLQTTNYQQQPHMTGQFDRRASASPNSFTQQIKPQKTGAWDEGLPEPLQVSRRSFDDYEYPQRQGRTSASPQTTSRSQSRQQSVHGISRTHTPSGLRESMQLERPEIQVTTIQEMPKNEFGFVEPVRQIAGGRMAELIERGY